MANPILICFIYCRGYEPIRLLGLQFLGRLLVGIPSEKKESKFFTLAMGRSKTLLEGPKRIELRLPPIFSAMSDRLFRFPQTDLLCATFFDVLLGGASPKQVMSLVGIVLSFYFYKAVVN